ncbi:amidohydrolase family protein [Thalassomonas actiniarum]|uniref:Amidohydrolase family protein n=1 Tax=Thalassomonas actiniarum TaxID=485447 RepID=A0AAF0C345_9GAMM|nr:amidohydrolase family protein [Thalassomonas actiniarum]WDE00807.1 amidohydrolase family protein [Thalassomonas actiniarum]
MVKKLTGLAALTLLLSACSTSSTTAGNAIDPALTKSPRDLAMFTAENKQCYDRSTESYSFVIDAHNHFRPFGGHAIPMHELDDYFRRLGVLFVNVYGIGQTLPVDSSCDYYLDCPDTLVIPSIKNDFRNASNYMEFPPDGLHLTLSMSFPNLAEPQWIKPQMLQLNQEYPDKFKWMGEVNLVKQALFQNGHQATPIEAIPKWADFMAKLREDKMPVAIHSDLGNDNEGENYKYLPLMDKVLELYPDNKIIWVHMGLSAELKAADPVKHIAVMKERLDKYPNLMLDISWRVIYDNYFIKPEIRALYVDFFNGYSTRILPGTDFVASRKKDFLVYAQEVEVTSRINLYLDDNAFRNIALGENYFRLMGMDKYQAPQICR